MSVEIRRAVPDDSAMLTEIAHAAKRHWGYPEGWILLWTEALTLTTEFVSTNEVHVAIRGDEPVGFYALLVTGQRAVLEHMWVSPASIGKGVGRKLFDHAARTAISFHATEMEIESDPSAEGFYLRMGCVRTGAVSSVIEGQIRALPRLVFQLSAADDPLPPTDDSAASS